MQTAQATGRVNEKVEPTPSTLFAVVGFRLFMDGHAFTASRAELIEALLGWLRACEAGMACGG